MKVLVVEDELWLSELLNAGLRALGHDVVSAPTGAAAIEMATAFQPDAVLLDVALPDMNGITLANILRGLSDESVRIVAYSGTSPETLGRAVERHLFDAYLSKPASLDRIETALTPRA